MAQSFAGHEVARTMRARGEAAHAVLPRADMLVWGTITALIAVGGGGVAAGVWWARKPPPPPVPVEMRVGPERLAVPPALLGPRNADSGREVGMVRLRVTWPELKAPLAGDRAEIHISVRPADPETDPRAQFAKLARFLQPGAWSNPGGLVARSFKTGSPYQADELYMSLPDGEDFFARCTVDVGPNRLDEGCRATLKHGPFDLALRFPRDALTRWDELASGARRLVDEVRAGPPTPR